MVKKIIFSASLLLSSQTFAASQFGGSIDYINFASQEEFATFSKQLTTALDFKSLTPATPLGSSGFDFGIGLSFANLDGAGKVFDSTATDTGDIDTSSLFNFISSVGAKFFGTFLSANTASMMPLVSMSISKGLPLNIDVGLNFTTSVFGNISTVGYEVSYAILEGSATQPAMNIKYKATQLSGVDVLDYKSSGAEFTISKGVGTVTPYGGFGFVNSEVTALATNKGAGVLSTASNTLDKFFVGVNVNLLTYDIFLDWSKIGRESVISTKLGFRF